MYRPQMSIFVHALDIFAVCRKAATRRLCFSFGVPKQNRHLFHSFNQIMSMRVCDSARLFDRDVRKLQQISMLQVGTRERHRDRSWS